MRCSPLFFFHKVSDSSLTVGAGVTLTKLIALLETNSSKSLFFSATARHISKIANTPVRNVATWAGNVMLAYQHQDFPSDIFLLLAATEAVLTIGKAETILIHCSIYAHLYSLASIPDLKKSSISMWEFLTIEEVSKLVSVMRVHRSVVFWVVQI